MRAVITRVSSASVSVDGEVMDELPCPGLLVLTGVSRDDDVAMAKTLAAKIWGLRILRDGLSASDIDAPILIVNQFTLFTSTRRGRRPGWSKVAPGPVSEPIVEALASELEALGATVERDRFDVNVQVASINDGPITILIDTTVWE